MADSNEENFAQRRNRVARRVADIPDGEKMLIKELADDLRLNYPNVYMDLKILGLLSSPKIRKRAHKEASHAEIDRRRQKLHAIFRSAPPAGDTWYMSDLLKATKNTRGVVASDLIATGLDQSIRFSADISQPTKDVFEERKLSVKKKFQQNPSEGCVWTIPSLAAELGLKNEAVRYVLKSLGFLESGRLRLRKFRHPKKKEVKDRRKDLTHLFMSEPPAGGQWTIPGLTLRLANTYRVDYGSVWADIIILGFRDSPRLKIREKATSDQMIERQKLILEKLSAPPSDGEQWNVNDLAAELGIAYQKVYLMVMACGIKPPCIVFRGRTQMKESYRSLASYEEAGEIYETDSQRLAQFRESMEGILTPQEFDFLMEDISFDPNASIKSCASHFNMSVEELIGAREHVWEKIEKYAEASEKNSSPRDGARMAGKEQKTESRRQMSEKTVGAGSATRRGGLPPQSVGGQAVLGDKVASARMPDANEVSAGVSFEEVWDKLNRAWPAITARIDAQLDGWGSRGMSRPQSIEKLRLTFEQINQEFEAAVRWYYERPYADCDPWGSPERLNAALGNTYNNFLLKVTKPSSFLLERTESGSLRPPLIYDRIAEYMKDLGITTDVNDCYNRWDQDRSTKNPVYADLDRLCRPVVYLLVVLDGFSRLDVLNRVYKNDRLNLIYEQTTGMKNSGYSSSGNQFVELSLIHVLFNAVNENDQEGSRLAKQITEVMDKDRYLGRGPVLNTQWQRLLPNYQECQKHYSDALTQRPGANVILLASALFNMKPAEREAFKAWADSQPEGSVLTIDRLIEAGSHIDELSACQLPVFDEKTPVLTIPKGDVAGLADQVFDIGKKLDLVAHGTSNFNLANLYIPQSRRSNLFGEWALLNVMIDGMLVSDGSIAKFGFGSTFASGYGPFFVVFRRGVAEYSIPSAKSGALKLDRSTHAIYLAPTDGAVVFFRKGLKKAMETGRMKQADFDDAIARIMTFDEFVRHQDRLNEIVEGTVTPAQVCATGQVLPRIAADPAISRSAMKGARMALTDEDLDRMMQWSDGGIVYHQAYLGQIRDFIVDDAGKMYYGTYFANKSFNAVLVGLSLSTEVKQTPRIRLEFWTPSMWKGGVNLEFQDISYRAIAYTPPELYMLTDSSKDELSKALLKLSAENPRFTVSKRAIEKAFADYPRDEIRTVIEWVLLIGRTVQECPDNLKFMTDVLPDYNELFANDLMNAIVLKYDVDEIQRAVAHINTAAQDVPALRERLKQLTDIVERADKLEKHRVQGARMAGKEQKTESRRQMSEKTVGARVADLRDKVTRRQGTRENPKGPAIRTMGSRMADVPQNSPMGPGPLSSGIRTIILNGSSVSVDHARLEIKKYFDGYCIFNAKIVGDSLIIGFFNKDGEKPRHHQDIVNPRNGSGIFRAIFNRALSEIDLVLEGANFAREKPAEYGNLYVRFARFLAECGLGGIRITQVTSHLYTNSKELAVRARRRSKPLALISEIADGPLLPETRSREGGTAGENGLDDGARMAGKEQKTESRRQMSEKKGEARGPVSVSVAAARLSEGQPLDFLQQVFSQQRKTGRIVIDSDLFELCFENNELIIRGYGRELLRTRDFKKIGPASPGAKAAAEISLTDFKVLLQNSFNQADNIPSDAALDQIEALGIIDLDALEAGSKGFEEIILLPLLEELRLAHNRPYGKNAKFLLSTKSEAVLSLAASRLAQRFPGQDFIYTDQARVPAEFQNHSVMVTTPEHAQAGMRNFYLKAPQEGDLLNHRVNIKLFLMSARIEDLAVTNPQFMRFKSAMELALGRSIENIPDFVDAIWALSDNKAYYALGALARVSLAGALRAARLAVRMSAQSA